MLLGRLFGEYRLPAGKNQVKTGEIVPLPVGGVFRFETRNPTLVERCLIPGIKARGLLKRVAEADPLWIILYGVIPLVSLHSSEIGCDRVTADYCLL